MLYPFALLVFAVAQVQAPVATIQTPQRAATAVGMSQPEVLTDENIIDLVKAGLGPATIIAKINASRGDYDTSTSALIRLKHAGVPDAVVAAMLSRSTSPTSSAAAFDNSNPNPLALHSPGIYLVEGGAAARMISLTATSSDQVKTSNYWGFALTAGLSSMKKVLVIPKVAAATQSADRRPTFYFYFGQPGSLSDLAGFNSNLAVSASSPNEFSLVHLNQKRDHREASIESINLISRVKSGVSDKARVAFTSEEISPGVFRVSPDSDLEPGQYAFMSSVAAGSDRDVVARIFDFSVE